jgi:hypothetical protein
LELARCIDEENDSLEFPTSLIEMDGGLNQPLLISNKNYETD